MASTDRPQITKTSDGKVKVTVTGKHGNQMSQAMDETATAALIYDLVKTLPDSDLAQHLHIK
jgi:hypothetical protein